MAIDSTEQLWQVRSKLGRAHFFKTPETLWEAALGYFKWCNEHPVYKSVTGGPKYEPGICIAKVRAYTLKGLCVYLGCGSRYFGRFEAQLTSKTDEVSVEFMDVISEIRDVIWEQKYTAAASGELNAGIIARELNLAYDKDLVTKNDTVRIEEPRKQMIIKWGDKEIPIG